MRRQSDDQKSSALTMRLAERIVANLWYVLCVGRELLRTEDVVDGAHFTLTDVQRRGVDTVSVATIAAGMGLGRDNMVTHFLRASNSGRLVLDGEKCFVIDVMDLEEEVSSLLAYKVYAPLFVYAIAYPSNKFMTLF